MQRHTNGSLEWLTFDLLSDIPKLQHAIYLRKGGASQGPYGSLNASFAVGDEPNHVSANLDLIRSQEKEHHSSWKRMVRGKAWHGISIAAVDHSSDEAFAETDGLITATPGISLMMTHADCQVALFYDPVNHAAANIHCGWRGNVQNIYREAVDKLKKQFGTNPANLLVGISPSLGPDEAEFMNYRQELPEEFWAFQVRPTYFDLWAISEWQLQATGILPHHIETARLSTYSNPQDFFSYRRDKITGRHPACITLL